MTARSDVRRELFCVEYMKDLNGTQAAIRAGYAPTHAKNTAHGLMQEETIQERIAALMVERTARTLASADDVIRELSHIALADHNELIELRRTCCRHCHGADHEWQYTTQGALNAAKARFERTALGLVEAFRSGGTGFNAALPPHPECPECSGEGVLTPHAKDTRNLSPAARSLYAGVKMTKDGIEIKTQSKEKALELLARHHGMLKDKIEVTGDLASAITNARKRTVG